MTYAPIVRSELWNYKPDFFARRTHFIDHIAPIWKELDEKGNFYVPSSLEEYAMNSGIDNLIVLPRHNSARSPMTVRPPGTGTIVTCAYGDMEQAWHSYALRPLILMEHGVGLTFNHPGYAGGEGLRRKVSLFLAPNKFIHDKTARTFPDAPQVIIGTPKLDTTICERPKKRSNPIVGIAFHWDGKAVCPEAGNALKHYIDVLPELANKFSIIGHGHPKIIDKLVPLYKSCGITHIETDFDKVMERCDVYINDASSTMYEFACTGKPVIILNAPWFRRNVYHGIRFWDYTDIGINVNISNKLIPAIQDTINHPEQFYVERCNMIKDLYPYMGQSAKRAAQAITTFIRSKRDGTDFSF